MLHAGTGMGCARGSSSNPQSIIYIRDLAQGAQSAFFVQGSECGYFSTFLKILGYEGLGCFSRLSAE